MSEKNGVERFIGKLSNEKTSLIAAFVPAYDYDALASDLAAARAAIKALDDARIECRKAISSLSIDALGVGRADEISWPLRDELLDAINKIDAAHGAEIEKARKSA